MLIVLHVKLNYPPFLICCREEPPYALIKEPHAARSYRNTSQEFVLWELQKYAIDLRIKTTDLQLDTFEKVSGYRIKLVKQKLNILPAVKHKTLPDPYISLQSARSIFKKRI